MYPMLWRTNMTKICQIHADKHKILLTTTGVNEKKNFKILTLWKLVP